MVMKPYITSFAWLKSEIPINGLFNICFRWISATSHACLPSSSAYPWTRTAMLEVRLLEISRCNEIIFRDVALWHLLISLRRLHDVANCIYFFPSGSIPSISESTAREAFILFASSKCCYSSGPAKDGVITNMEAFNTYRVKGSYLFMFEISA